jgi:hypothetical protein
MDPENCACSFFMLALLRTKLHFGLLHFVTGRSLGVDGSVGEGGVELVELREFKAKY